MNKSDIYKNLDAMKVNAIRLLPSEHIDVFSKLGGLPDLPFGIDWPQWRGMPLSFVAQIDLSEITECSNLEGLPSKGRLYFFYDQEQSTWGFSPGDKDSWRVLYVDDQSKIAGNRVELTINSSFDEKHLKFQHILSLPDLKRLDSDAFPNDMFDELYEYKMLVVGDPPLHQIGGYPDPIQNDTMELECQLVSNGIDCGHASSYETKRALELSSEAYNWRLLLQVDTDDDSGMSWGGGGRLYFWIHSTDLAKCDFSNVWMILQTS